MWQKISRWLPITAGGERRSGLPDAADMGVDFGLDAMLEPALPPLYDFAAVRSDRPAVPFGTDRRSVRPGEG